MASAKDVKDVLDSRREFIFEQPDGTRESYFIGAPGAVDIRKADWQYSKVYNQAIVDGLLTQSQMVDLLREKGILSDEYSEKMETVRINLAAELFKLENMGSSMTDDARESAAMEIARLRDQLFRLNQQVNGPMGNTCENLAEDARVDFLTSRIIQNKDGSRVWESYEDYQNEENYALTVKSRFEVMLWLQGLESNFMESTPEQKALREIAQKRLDFALEESKNRALKNAEAEEQSASSPANEYTDELELPEEVAAPKPKAKKGRPRKTKGSN